MEYKVMAGFGCNNGNSMIIQGEVTRTTNDEEYEREAEKVFRFLQSLPSGTIDRVVRKLKNS